MPRPLLAVLAFAAGCAGSPQPARSGTASPFASSRCVQESIRLGRGDALPHLVVVAFQISPGGEAQEIRFLAGSDATEEVRSAIERAILSCRWEPGRNAAGEAIPTWVTMPIKFIGG